MPPDLTQAFFIAKLPPGGGAQLTELDLSRQIAAGSITGAEIVQRVGCGTLRRTDLCWRQGMPGWVEIGQTFASHLGDPANDPPPAPPEPEPAAPTPPPPVYAFGQPPQPEKDTRWLALVIVVFWWMLTLIIVAAVVAVVVAILLWLAR